MMNTGDAHALVWEYPYWYFKVNRLTCFACRGDDSVSAVMFFQRWVAGNNTKFACFPFFI
jgi:hypothetical protein